ncbi:hypothetical protein [Polyangium sp. 6x1]|uniref:hypothetical protein n=1 Tax=Polyangium sp. 6x1 TaxID=3042689 RepID=UPI00248329B3|nr:hypothetical protein [Polyangium sp. 6x1]MDI1442847.1 hypothetical protein [Polyangium sp. 6x1]
MSFHVPFPSNPDTPAQERLPALHTRLLEHDFVVLHRFAWGAPNDFCVSSRLAVQYAHRYKEFWSPLYWVEQGADPTACFTLLAEQLHLAGPGVSRAAKLRALGDHLRQQREALLIVDNVDDPHKLRAEVDALLGRTRFSTHVLVVTRAPDPKDPARADEGPRALRRRWDALESVHARRLLQAAALLEPRSTWPRELFEALLGLKPSEVVDALDAASALGLVERFTARLSRLPPAVLGFVPTTLDDLPGLAGSLAEQISPKLLDPPQLVAEMQRRGPYDVLGDLRAALRLCALAEDEGRTVAFASLLAALEPVAGVLRHGEAEFVPQHLLQMIRNGCLRPELGDLRGRAEAILGAGMELPHLRERFDPSTLSSGSRGAVDLVAAGARLALTARRGAWAREPSIDVWDVKTGEVVWTLHWQAMQITALGITADDRFAVALSNDALAIWEIPEGEPVAEIRFAHEPRVLAVAGGRLLVGLRGGTAAVIDVEGKLLHEIVAHEGDVCAVAMTPDGKLGFSASDDGMLKVWDLETGTLARTLAGDPGPVRALVLTADEERIIVVPASDTLLLADLQGRDPIFALHSHRGLQSVACPPWRNAVVSVGGDGTLQIWSLPPVGGRGNAPLHILPWSAPMLCCSAISSQRTFVAGDGEGGVHLVDWYTGVPLGAVENLAAERRRMLAQPIPPPSPPPPPPPPPRDGKRMKEWLEENAAAWVRGGCKNEDLLEPWDVVIAGAWNISDGGRREGLSDDAKELIKKSFEADEGHYYGILESRSSCSRCGERYRVENLSLCTHCAAEYCHRCTEDAPRHDNGNRRCGCKWSGEIVG